MSAGYERIRFGVEGGVATLVLDNPAKRNAFDLDMWRALPPIFAALGAEPEARVVVLSGAAGLPFCSGADISEFSTVRATSEADLQRLDNETQAHLFEHPDKFARMDAFLAKRNRP